MQQRFENFEELSQYKQDLKKKDKEIQLNNEIQFLKYIHNQQLQKKNNEIITLKYVYEQELKKKEDEIIWRYFKVPELEYIEEPKKEIQIKEEIKPKVTPIAKIEQTTIIENPISKLQKETHKTVTLKKTKKKTTAKKQNDKFFNKVKEFLSKNSIEILDIENFNKNELILRVKNDEKEQFLIAYNKKKINEDDIIKAHKKFLEFDLPYAILSLSDIPKKLNDFLRAIKSLEKIEKIE